MSNTDQLKYKKMAANRASGCSKKTYFLGFVAVIVCIFAFLLFSIYFNVSHLTTTVKQQAERITELEKEHAEYEDVLKTQSIEQFRLKIDVASVREDLTNDEITVRNYSRYLLHLKTNFTLMLTAELRESDTNDTLLRKKMEHLQQQIDLTQEHLDHVNRTIGDKIGRPMNIFKQCKFSETSCVIGSNGNGHYWKACSTHFLPEEEQVSN